jgi:pimeloyl-ACP methyl ester carboxylesterase
MLLTYRQKKLSSLTPENKGLAFEKINFTTFDKLILKGWLVKPLAKISFNDSFDDSFDDSFEKPLIVICHGNGREKSEYLDKARFLAENGYYTFLYDMRGHGKSQGTVLTLGALETLDAGALIDTMKKRGFKSFVFWGWSMGGAVSLLSLEKYNEICAAISDCPFDTYYNVVYHTSKLWLGRLPRFMLDFTIATASWAGKFNPKSVNCIRALKKTPFKPVLLVLGNQDKRVPYGMAQNLASAALDTLSVNTSGMNTSGVNTSGVNTSGVNISGINTAFDIKGLNPDNPFISIKNRTVWYAPGCGHLQVWNKFKPEYKKLVLDFIKKQTLRQNPAQNKKVGKKEHDK